MTPTIDPVGARPSRRCGDLVGNDQGSICDDGSNVHPEELDDLVAMAPDGIHVVYHLCARRPGVDPEEEVIDVYVGVTSHLRRRLREHARKWWWAALDLSLVEFLTFDSRAEADEVERQLIALYQPEMNRAGRVLQVVTI